MENDRERRIQARAHELWEQAGRPHGRHDEHWSQAEREIDAAKESGGTTGAGTAGKEAKPKRPPKQPDEFEDAGDIAMPEPDRDGEQRGL